MGPVDTATTHPTFRQRRTWQFSAITIPGQDKGSVKDDGGYVETPV